MSKHTKGPWTATEYVGDIVVRSGFTECALVRPILHGDNPTGQRVEQCANARLIALAPELVDMLKQFAYLDESVPSDLWAIDKSLCESARALLAKVDA